MRHPSADQNGPVRPPTLDAVSAVDDESFRAVMSPHVRELHPHCYRMLGSLTDADDAPHHVLLAAWRGLDGFAPGTFPSCPP